MHRFFVSPNCISGDVVTLHGEVARQLARVLRLRPGDRIIVLDDSGWEYLVTLESVGLDPSAGSEPILSLSKGQAMARGAIVERQPSRGEPGVRITLYQGVLKGEKFEFVLQKGTELGVSAFVPVFCARSVPREQRRGTGFGVQGTGEDHASTPYTKGKSGEGRYPRWRRIVTEAAEQSHRGRIPALETPLDFERGCDVARKPAIIPWEGPDLTPRPPLHDDGEGEPLAKVDCDGERRGVQSRGERSRTMNAPALRPQPRSPSPPAERGRAEPAYRPESLDVRSGLRSILTHWKSEGWDGATVSIFIGPEGGFTEEEIAYARERGISPVSLGNRILRSETAAIATVSAVLYELNELGS
jgi:16S rRNA (uracil1498-N3)-methyltransferase